MTAKSRAALTRNLLSSLRDRARSGLAATRINQAQDYDSALFLLILIQAPAWVFLAWRLFA